MASITPSDSLTSTLPSSVVTPSSSESSSSPSSTLPSTTSSGPTSSVPATTTSSSQETSVPPSTTIVGTTQTVIVTISGTTSAVLSTGSATQVVDPRRHEDSGLSSGAKIGIGVGAGVGGGLLLLALLFLLCTRYLRRRRTAYTPGEDEIKWPAAEQEADTLFPAAVRPTGGAGMLQRDQSLRSTAAGTSYNGTSSNTGGASSVQHGGTYENGYHPSAYSGYPSTAAAHTSYDSASGPAGYEQSYGGQYSGAGRSERSGSVVERQVGGQLSSQGHSYDYEPYSPSEYSTGTGLDRGASIVSRPGPLRVVEH